MGNSAAEHANVYHNPWSDLKNISGMPPSNIPLCTTFKIYFWAKTTTPSHLQLSQEKKYTQGFLPVIFFSPENHIIIVIVDSRYSSNNNM